MDLPSVGIEAIKASKMQPKKKKNAIWPEKFVALEAYIPCVEVCASSLGQLEHLTSHLKVLINFCELPLSSNTHVKLLNSIKWVQFYLKLAYRYILFILNVLNEHV